MALVRLSIVAVLVFVCGSMARAQAAPEPAEGPPAKINWVTGPAKVQLGTIAEMQLPAGYRFADAGDTAKLMEAMQNPVSGSEIGTVIPPEGKSESASDADDWFVVFSFDEIGYVKDDEKANIDDKAAEKILTSIREGNERGNVERAKRGWAPLHIKGWAQKPFYDDVTKNLTWSILANSEGSDVANYDGRILGRKGVIQATMVADPSRVQAIVPAYRNLVKNISFVSGHRYSEFRSGDKIAQYGLVGLITGGTAVAVAKGWKGIAKLGAFILIGIAAVAKKVWGMITGQRQQA